MLRRLLPLLLLCSLLPVGCVRSMHPIYTEQTLTYDPAFLGTWRDDDGTTVEVAASDGNDEPDAVKSYRVAVTGRDNKTARLVGHLAKVGDLLVADLTVGDEEGLPDSDVYRAHLFPLHTFWVVRRDGEKLAVRTIEHDWMKKFVEADPGAIAHYKSRDDVILTAPPEALQKFLLAHAKDPGMLSDEGTYRRVKPGATTAPATSPRSE